METVTPTNRSKLKILKSESAFSGGIGAAKQGG